MRIVVCDDESISLDYNVMLLENFFSKINKRTEIMQFSNPMDVVKEIENTSFDIYILDMIMPQMSGIDLGRRIREKDLNAQIIFLTADKESALEAYDVNPLHYLIKPVNIESLSRALDLAISKISPKESRILIKSKTGIHNILIMDILYVEHTQRKAKFTLADGTTIESLTIVSGFSDMVKPITENEEFIIPHSSFVINMNAIKDFEKDSFIMKNGQQIPIATRKLSAMKNKFLNFIGNEYK